MKREGFYWTWDWIKINVIAFKFELFMFDGEDEVLCVETLKILSMSLHKNVVTLLCMNPS